MGGGVVRIPWWRCPALPLHVSQARPKAAGPHPATNQNHFGSEEVHLPKIASACIFLF